MEKATVICELSEKITKAIGFPLRENCIFSLGKDGSGWGYYIENLKPGYPVLAMHYRGSLMLALPFADYAQLESGEITVDQYVANSHWNYGYYWSGGSLLDGIYWQPLEDGVGIHDKERISRYLQIMHCRTCMRSSGYRPTVELCQRCKLVTPCPLSPLSQKCTWEAEIAEPDGRRLLFEAVAQRIKSELGFNCFLFRPHGSERDEILLCPGYELNRVKVCLHKDVLNDLLYHPKDNYDWGTMAQNFNVGLFSSWPPRKKTAFPDDIKDRRAFCLKFWSGEMLQPANANIVDSYKEVPCLF